jgi:hypothetical protein
MKLIRRYSFLLVLTLFTIFYTYLNLGIRYELIPLTLFLLIGLLSLYGLFLSIDKHAISLNKTFCLFYYFFFSIAPIVQFKHNLVFFLENKFISNALYEKGAGLLLVLLLVYLVLYHFVYSYFNEIKSKIHRKVKDKINVLNGSILIIISIISVVFYLYLIKFNWDLLIFRPFDFRLKYNTNLGLFGYAILNVIQLVPFCCLVYYKLRTQINDKTTYILLFLMLLVCFPTSLPRGIVAILYIPMCLLFIPILTDKKYYIKMYLLGLLLAFPLFNNFRHLYERNFSFNYELFETAHFDAFQNFAFLLDEKIITNGRQLLGSVFFFVQEGQWIDRPLGSGTLLAEKLGYSFTNVDMCFFGEGYANFGYFGMFLFLAVITLFNAFMDDQYASGKMSYLLKTIFYIFLGFEFYLLRGDLYSSIKIISSFTIATGLVVFVFYIINRWRKCNE